MPASVNFNENNFPYFNKILKQSEHSEALCKDGKLNGTQYNFPIKYRFIMKLYLDATEIIDFDSNHKPELVFLESQLYNQINNMQKPNYAEPILNLKERNGLKNCETIN